MEGAHGQTDGAVGKVSGDDRRRYLGVRVAVEGVLEQVDFDGRGGLEPQSHRGVNMTPVGLVQPDDDVTRAVFG